MGNIISLLAHPVARRMAGCFRSTGTLDALRKNKSVTMNTLHDICVILDCPIEAVVKIEKGDK